MKSEKIDLKHCFSLFQDYWSPKVVTELNDYQVKVVKLKGDFVWHSHSDTDELFFVLEGKLDIELQEKTVSLSSGEMMVVPKGVMHKPFAKEECRVLLIEPKGVVNTGEAGGEKTAAVDEWLIQR